MYTKNETIVTINEFPLHKLNAISISNGLRFESNNELGDYTIRIVDWSDNLNNRLLFMFASLLKDYLQDTSHTYISARTYECEPKLEDALVELLQLIQEKYVTQVDPHEDQH